MEKRKPTVETPKIQSVLEFLTDLEHPLKKEIEEIRKIVLNSHQGVTEIIKWNAPNFCFEGEDRITMRIHPFTQIQLIFHRGAKVKQQPEGKLINDVSGLLSWKTNDRAVATFLTMADIEAQKEDLLKIIADWLAAAKDEGVKATTHATGSVQGSVSRTKLLP